MPFIEMKTSVSLGEDKREELKSLFGNAMPVFSKSEKWLMVNFFDNCPMYFGGEKGDIAMIDFSLFGSANDGRYDEMTEIITKGVSEIAGIPSDKIYIKYSEIDHWGFDGFNF